MFIAKIKMRLNIFIFLITLVAFNQCNNASDSNSNEIYNTYDLDALKEYYNSLIDSIDTEPTTSEIRLDIYNHLLNLSIKNNYPEGISRSLYYISFYYLNWKKIDSSKIYLEKLKNCCYKLKDSICYSRIYKIEAHILDNLTEHKDAIAKYNDALSVTPKSDSNMLMAILDNQAISLIWEGKINKAVEIREITLKYYLNNNQKNKAAGGFLWIGNLYKEKGNFNLSYKNYLEALKIYEEIGHKQGEAWVLGSIAALLNNNRQHDEAIRYTKKSIALFEKLSLTNELAISYRNSINIYTTGSKTKESEKDSVKYLFEIGLQYAKKMNDSIQIINMYISYINYLQVAGELKKSLLYIDKLMTKFNIDRLPIESKASIYLNAADLYISLKHKENAYKYIHYVESILDTVQPILYSNLLMLKFKADFAFDNCKNTMPNIEKYIEYQLRFTEKNRDDEIQRLKVEYETEKKDIAISELNLNKQIQQLKIEQQKKTVLVIIIIGIFLIGLGFLLFRLRTKQLIQATEKQITNAQLTALKSLMDNHFISGALNTVDAFIMQNEKEKASRFLVNFSKLTRQILDKSQLHETSLGEELNICKLYLEMEQARHQNAFDFEIEVANNINCDNVLFPSLMLQPIVENAVKHGIGSIINDNIPRRGKIVVKIEIADNKLLCTVIDNGTGNTIENKQHRSWSRQGIEERISVYNKLYGNKSSFNINTSSEETKVILVLPLLTKNKEA